MKLVHIQTEKFRIVKILDDYFIQEKKRFLLFNFWKTILRTTNQDLAVEYFSEVEPLNN